MNQVDTEKLEQHISDLQGLYNTWLAENEQPVDAGESGGNTIAQMEALGKVLLDMREGFILLLDRTISYMEGRRDSVDGMEYQSASGISAQIK